MRELRLLFLCLWLISFSSYLYGQSLQVVSPNQAPLTGVELWSSDYQFSGITDDQGMINITDWDEQKTLNLRFLGFQLLQLSSAQIRARKYVIVLIPQSYQTEEVVIYGRQSFDKEDIPTQIKTINSKEIRSTNPQTAADALSQHGGVFIQKSQMGGGSPIIRGFEANRVLLVLDGVRLNNAIYRNGHLQNAITVDPAIMDRMDVIFGPNSLMYGSDALGGVVHFQTRHPKFGTSDKNESSTNFYLRHNTVNQEKSAHLDFNLGTKNFASLTSVTYADYGNLRAGNNRSADYPEFGKRLIYQSRYESDEIDQALINEDPNIQIGTAYNQLDLLQKMSWIINEESDLDINLQYSTSSDVPRYDNLSELRRGTLRFAEWYYGPHNRFLASILYNSFKSTTLYDRMKIIGSYQRIDEDRISRLWQNNIREIQEEDVSVTSLTLDFSKDLISDKLRLDYGVDIQYNSVLSSAFGQNIILGSTTDDVLSRYGSGENSLTNSGAYVYLKKLGELLDMSLGFRYARTDYFISYDANDPVDWPSFLLSGVYGSNDAFTFSTSAKLKLSEGIFLNAIISSAFRSPNIDDLSKIRINGSEISFPNLDLSAENSLNFELGLSGQLDEDFSFDTYFYLTQLSDAIVRQNFRAPNGSSTYNNRGETLRVVANQNVAEALIYGFTSQISYNPIPTITANASINWIRGDEIVQNGENQHLSHIPPTYGQASVKYNQGVLMGSVVYRFNGLKPINRYGGSVDNPEFATPEGALAWNTLNLYGSYEITEQFSLSVGMENIFDRHYRPFASGVSAAGRGITFALRGSF